MFRTITVTAALLFLATPVFAGGKNDPRCSQYGEGFSYSADTGMCIKISGDFRADYTFDNRNHGAAINSSLDARGNSDYGSFRAVVEPRAGKY